AGKSCCLTRVGTPRLFWARGRWRSPGPEMPSSPSAHGFPFLPFGPLPVPIPAAPSSLSATAGSPLPLALAAALLGGLILISSMRRRQLPPLWHPAALLSLIERPR